MANEFVLQNGHGYIFMWYLEDIFEMSLIATEMKICTKVYRMRKIHSKRDILRRMT